MTGIEVNRLARPRGTDQLDSSVEEEIGDKRGKHRGISDRGIRGPIAADPAQKGCVVAAPTSVGPFRHGAVRAVASQITCRTTFLPLPTLRLVASSPSAHVLRGVTSVNRRRVEYAWITPMRARRRAPTLILLHESIDCLAAWREFPRALVGGTGCPALVFSRPGCGQSDPPLEQRRSDYLHVEANAILPALLSQHGIERPLLVGHGDGASLALIHAASFAVVGVAAMAPYAFVEEQTLSRIRVARAVYESSDWKKKLARLHRDPDATFRAWSDIWIDPAFRDWNIEPALASVTAPIVLLQGEDDPFATVAQLTTIARAVGGPVKSVELEAVGHSPWQDAPAAVIAAIAELVEGIAPTK